MNVPRVACCLLLSSIAWPTGEALSQATSHQPPPTPRVTADLAVIAVRPGDVLELQAPEHSRAEFAWNGGDWMDFTGPIEIPRGHGNQWLATISRDEVGTTSDVAWHLIYVDSRGPELHIRRYPEDLDTRTIPGWFAAGDEVICKGKDPAGIESTTWMDLKQPGSSPRALPDATGTYSLDCEGRDGLGNRTVTTHLVFVDADPPRLAFSTANGSAADGQESWNIAPMRVVASVKDEESGIAQSNFRVDGQTVSSDVWVATAGTHVLELTATDRLGNTSTLKTTVRVDEAEDSSSNAGGLR